MDRMENYQIGHTPAKGEEFKIERNVCHDAHVEVAFSHRHTFYALYWIHWGEGEHMIDFEHYAILPNLGAIFGLVCAMIWNIVWIDAAVALVCSLVIVRWARKLLWDTGKQLISKRDAEKV